MTYDRGPLCRCQTRPSLERRLSAVDGMVSPVLRVLRNAHAADFDPAGCARHDPTGTWEPYRGWDFRASPERVPAGAVPLMARAQPLSVRPPDLEGFLIPPQAHAMMGG